MENLSLPNSIGYIMVSIDNCLSANVAERHFEILFN